MPIYGYRCGQCGHELEVFQSMSDPPLRACPECDGGLSKMLYPVGVHFKGSGFYSTDYRKNGEDAQKEDAQKKDAKSEPLPTGDTTSAADTTTASSIDKKPEKKPEKKSDSVAGKE